MSRKPAFGLVAALWGAITIFSSTVPAQASDYPLFKTYPELEKRMPRLEISKGFTPVEELRGLEAALKQENAGSSLQGRLWVKRDDRSWEPLGGNKTRKLEFLLGDARTRNADMFVTAGMYGSNHALTTALVAHGLGFKTRLILGPQPVTEIVKEKLLALHALGAEMHFHGNRIGMGLEMLKYMIGGPCLDRKGIYYIPPGGSDDIGSVGYVNAFYELLEQVGADGLPDDIVVPVGTGGTAAGLLVGSCLSGNWERVKIHGVETVDRMLYNEHKLRKDARSLYDSLVAKLDPASRAKVPSCDFEHSQKALEFRYDYFAPKYGAATPEVEKAIALLKQTEGLVMDTTYSGKALSYFLDLVRARLKPETKQEGGQAPRFPKMMFWHTYNSYPLAKVIESFPWHDPANKWKDLPEDFQKLFR